MKNIAVRTLQHELGRALLAAALGVACCLPAQAGDASGLKRLGKELKKTAAEISPKLSGKVCVTDFSGSGDLLNTSEFGQTAASLLSTALSDKAGKKFELVGRYELLKIMRDSAIFGDPDTVQRLSRDAGMDTLVSGEYSGSGSRVSLSVRAVDARTGKILAARSILLDKTPDLEKMMARKFRQLGVPPEKEENAKESGPVLEVETGVYFEGADGKLYPLREGMVLTSDDNYAIYFKPKQSSYIYAFQVDSANKVFRLFPNADYSSAVNPVPAAAEHWLPEKGFLFLDKRIGKEEILIFAGRSPMTGLENLKDASFASVEEAIKLMGVGGKRGEETAGRIKDPSGAPIQLITRKMIADGGFYYRLSFIHR
jgi:curli biogenesis system outer membrane secretion channel CsgG